MCVTVSARLIPGSFDGGVAVFGRWRVTFCVCTTPPSSTLVSRIHVRQPKPAAHVTAVGVVWQVRADRLLGTHACV